MTARRLHIAGSANPQADLELLADTHRMISALVGGWSRRSGTFVLGLGGEPTHDSDPAMPRIFDWTVAKAALRALRAGEAQPRGPDGHLLAVRMSQRARTQIPAHRQPIFDELLERDAMDLQFLPDQWRSGALMRRAQAAQGQILMTFSGGAGVEDLADLYAARGHPVIPIDVQVGSSARDATVGGTGLARRALQDAAPFMRLADGGSGSARLAALSMGANRPTPDELARRALVLLDGLEPPRAFCVRLLAPQHRDYPDVDRFFTDIVRPVVEQDGFRVVDLGVDPQERAWMNEEIFCELHFATLAFVDLTALRPNCLIELGYALGRAHRTIITARTGQTMPFDADKLPWHFWNPTGATADQQAALRGHIRQYGSRAPLVEPASLL